MRPTCALLCALLWSPPLIKAQTPSATSPPEMSMQQSPATFKSGVNLVLVPVVVRDRQGHAIGNLKKEDFQLFDKGKLQTISRFSLEKSGKAATEEQPRTANGSGAPKSDVETPTAAAAMPDRYVAYLFDDLHIQFGDLVRVQKAAIHHLATDFQPTERAAIYTTSGQGNLDFTDDRAKLQQAVENLRPQPRLMQRPNDCPYMTYYLADQIVNKNNQDLLQTLENDTMVCMNLPTAQAAASIVQSTASSFLPMGDQDTRVTLGVFRDLIRRMSILPGQRAIILTSPGFLTLTMESFDDLGAILDRAARASVMISAVDARGLYTDSTFDASEQGSATTQMQLKKAQYQRESDTVQTNVLAELADGTGGTFFQNNNDLDAGLKRVAAVPEYVYLLGFSPQNFKADGTFHKLKVITPDQKGLSIQARRGYYAPKHTTNTEETAKNEIQEAVFSREEMHDILVDLHTQFFKPDPADAKLTVLARVDLSHIHFKKVEGRNRNDITVVAALFDLNGNYVMGARKVIEMRLKDETLQKLSSGITVRNSFDIKPGTYLVRLVVRDTEGQLMSAQNGSVDIP